MYTTIKFVLCPSYILVPSSYLVCDLHKDKDLQFEDVYNADGSRKRLTKDDK